MNLNPKFLSCELLVPWYYKRLQTYQWIGETSLKSERFETDERQFCKCTSFQVVPMLGMVVIVFILCWTPILIFEVLQSFGIIGTQIFGIVKHTKTVLSLLSYFNRYSSKRINIFKILNCSCINPVIYGFMSTNFRKSFKEALCKCQMIGTKDSWKSSTQKKRR